MLVEIQAWQQEQQRWAQQKKDQQQSQSPALPARRHADGEDRPALRTPAVAERRLPAYAPGVRPWGFFCAIARRKNAGHGGSRWPARFVTEIWEWSEKSG